MFNVFACYCVGYKCREMDLQFFDEVMSLYAPIPNTTEQTALFSNHNTEQLLNSRGKSW